MSEYRNISNINLSYSNEEDLIYIKLQDENGRDISITRLDLDISEKLYKGIKKLLQRWKN
jgi:hypothetical protein